MHAPEKPPSGPTTFRIGECVVDPDANRISGPLSTQQIEPKAMQVLCVLADQQGHTVRREALLDEVWAGRVVVDETLTRSVSLLRQAFQSVAGQSSYIQTVPKKGYRLTAPVSGPVVESVNEVDSTTKKGQGWSIRLSLRLVLGLVGVCLLVLLIVGWDYWRGSTDDTVKPATGITSVAVLPFERLDESDETGYLAAGVAEELINALASVPDLRVPSRHSSFAVDRRTTALSTIAEQLDVRHVLEGSVRRAGDAIRINARLIEVASDTTLWSRQYEGQITDIFAVEEEIATEVVQALQAMSDVGDLGARFTRTPNIEAYNYYLEGQYWWMNGTTGNWFYQARDAFEQAVASDPNFAEAYASLAYIYARHDFHDRYMPRDLARQKSSEAIERALSLDNEVVDAYLARAMLATSTNDFPTAREAVEAALAIEPRNPVTHYIESELLLALNRPDAALKAAERALDIDPLSAWVNVNLGIVHYYRGEYVAAIKAIDEAIRIDPKHTWAHLWKAMIRHAQGRLADAVISLQECLALDPKSESNAILLGYLYLDLMDVPEAQRCFEHAASLQGDTGTARLWRRMTQLAYARQDDPMLLALAAQAGDALHSARYTLAPVIHSAFITENKASEGRALLISLMSGADDKHAHVQPKDGVVAMLLAESEGANSDLAAALAEAVAAYPQTYQRQGLTAQWHVYQGDTGAALRSLSAALETGWLIHWWMLPHLPAFADLQQTEAFNAVLANAQAHARKEARKLAAMME